MLKITIRELIKDDLYLISDLFNEHLFHSKRDGSIVHPSTRRLIKNLYLLSILNVPLNSVGLNTLFGSVAQTDVGDIIGVIIARKFPLGKNWIIGPIVVHTNFRRLNLATRMMNFVIKFLKNKKAKCAILSIERDNIPGRSFFEKFGFKYLEPIFNNHDKARNYVRINALINRHPRTNAHHSRIKVFDSSQLYKKREWCIMLLEF